MDPLPQYPDHAFIPYLSPPSSPTSPISLSSDISTPAVDLPPIILLNTSTWTYCGPLLPLTPSALPPSFHTWSASTITGSFLPRLLPFFRFLNTFLKEAGAQHYWLTIRATKPTTEYDTVRWHTDDLFFDYDGEKDRLGLDQKQRQKRRRRKKNPGYWKLATTLLGPGTLFLRDGTHARRTQRAAKAAECASRGEHTCTDFRCLGCLDAVEAVRQTLAKSFEHEVVESPEYGEAAFFRLGDEEGAVHSEPPCHTDRIFVNVVPGSEDELRGLMGRWGMGAFPRSWCFGVPMGFAGFEGVAPSVSLERPLPRSLPIALGVTQLGGHEEDEDEDDEGDGDVVMITARDSINDDARSVTTSTMSLNLREEYTDWLREKGFQFSQIFGQAGEKRDSKREDSGVALDRMGEGVGMKAGFNI